MPRIRQLGRVDYAETLAAMQNFADTREPDTPDELWFLEHPPVFTLGLNTAPEHLLNPGDIPVIQTDRGGQVTYHGPGQLVVYTLVDIRRAGLNVRQLVCALERAVIELLSGYGISAAARADAPGVYVDGAKIASLGLRIRKGSSFHGLALNVAMDLEPFSRINPCGFADLPVTQLVDQGGPRNLQEVAGALEPPATRRTRSLTDLGSFRTTRVAALPAALFRDQLFYFTATQEAVGALFDVVALHVQPDFIVGTARLHLRELGEHAVTDRFLNCHLAGADRVLGRRRHGGSRHGEAGDQRYGNSIHAIHD